MSRLTLLHINIIGFFVAVVVGVALYFTLITGAQEQIQANETTYNGIKADADKLPGAKIALKKAQDDKKRTEIDYAGYNSNYMPLLGYSKNRIETMMRVWWPNSGRSWPERFIRGVRAHMAGESKRLHVTWLNPEVLVLPSYGPDPNAIDMGGDPKTLHFGPYAFSVRGKSYQALMSHIRDWTNLRGLGVPTVEGVTLTGNSPDLIASYSVTFTLILKEELPPTDSRVAGSGGNQGGGAGGFGPPGGGKMSAMMGGPGMMGGSPGPMMMGGSASMMGGGGSTMGGGKGAAGKMME